MTFAEKLKRLTRDMNRSKLCRRADLPLSAIGEYLNGAVPRADGAARLARALGVSLDWLFDEARGFPAIRVDEAEACHAA